MGRFNRTISVAFLVVVIGIAFSMQAVAVTNLLGSYNPGFEEPLSGGAVPHWVRPYGSASLSADAHSGSKSLLCSNSTALSTDQHILVEPGYTYHISGWVKYSDVVNGAGYGIGMGLNQHKADGNENANWYFCTFSVPRVDGSSGWIFVEGSLYPRETTSYLEPKLLTWVDSGQIWYDDIVVWKEATTNTTVNTFEDIAVNGSFEARDATGTKATGYSVVAPAGQEELYNNHVTCVEDVVNQGVASMKMTGECVVVSETGYTAALTTVNAKIAVKTDAITGTGAYAKLVFLNASKGVVSTTDVATLTGTSDWQVYSANPTGLSSTIRYIRWELGMKPGSTGTVYFDALQTLAPVTYTTFPIRTKDTARGAVTVDCSTKMNTFTSPLSGFDMKAHLSLAPTLGTAGSYVQGPGRWFSQRSRLGVRYIRTHEIFAPHVYSAASNASGGYTISTGDNRTDIDTGLLFPDEFSASKYLIDKYILETGCKPVIQLTPYPAALMLDATPASEFQAWREKCRQFVSYLVAQYGKKEILSWMFEVDNEPWATEQAVMNRYFKVWDNTVAGITTALPDAFIAGPSGPGEFLVDPFIDHCATGTNYATGAIGTKLDALSYHGYQDGNSGDMSWRPLELLALKRQTSINRFYQMTGKKIKLFDTESAPIAADGVIDLASIDHTRNNHITALAYLHYASFARKVGNSMLIYFLEAPNYPELYGGVSRENVPEFAGYNTMITFHGIWKPICRAYEIMSKLNGCKEVSASASKEPLYVVAGANDTQIKVLCYSFDVNPQVSYSTLTDITINTGGIGSKFNVSRYEMSATKANSWYLAQQRSLTQADCLKDSSIVDTINHDSELLKEDAGQVTAASNTVTLRYAIPSYSAVLFVLDKVQ